MERFNPDYAGFCISTRNEQDVERRCQGFNPDYAGFCISTSRPPQERPEAAPVSIPTTRDSASPPGTPNIFYCPTKFQSRLRGILHLHPRYRRLVFPDCLVSIPTTRDSASPLNRHRAMHRDRHVSIPTTRDSASPRGYSCRRRSARATFQSRLRGILHLHLYLDVAISAGNEVQGFQSRLRGILHLHSNP